MSVVPGWTDPGLHFGLTHRLQLAFTVSQTALGRGHPRGTAELGCYSLFSSPTTSKGFRSCWLAVLSGGGRNALPSGPSAVQRACCFPAKAEEPQQEQQEPRARSHGASVAVGFSVPHTISILPLPFFSGPRTAVNQAKSCLHLLQRS